MSIVGFIILVIVAAICGAVGQALSGYSVGGCFVSALVGFIGAFIGLWVARQFGLPEFIPLTIDGETFPVIWSIIGSAIVSLVLGLISRRRVVRR